jgi:Holliday junction DNA helicase RuvA
MLGFVHGKIISRNIESLHCVVLTQGVGYEVLVPKRTLEKMLLSSEVSLWLHTHVREDILTLYGFESENEKVFFRLLLSVSGLGPKTALSLLSEFGADTLIELILGKRISEISKAPGVGKKTAERLVMELSTKLEKVAWSKPTTTPHSLRDDLYSALTHLGYQPTQIKLALDKVLTQEEQAFEVLLKNSLKELSNRNLNSQRPTPEVGNG